jgi:hypothetical protein
MARVVHDQQHRKELVAGGMADYLLESKSWTVKQSFFVSQPSQAIATPVNG